jgi:riboflavin synthase
VFTGIIEANVKVIETFTGDQSIKIILQRPLNFDDISIGDSIACNGVCLTIENFNQQSMSFSVGYETLKITGWSLKQLQSMNFNLERSLKFGDRIHGHLVSGHVDTVTPVNQKMWMGDCLILKFKIPEKNKKEIWTKSSIAINGVSLTVNKVENSEFEVCLIPETLNKTNLADLKEGDGVNLETDYYMKGLLSSQGVIHA